MAKSLWKIKYIVDGYELAKSGMTEGNIAKTLGISLPTLHSWKQKKASFRMALKRGRLTYKGKGKTASTFIDYVFRRLTPELQVLWKKIRKLDKVKTGAERIEAILANRGVRVRQNLFIHAWTSSNFSISQALRKVNISRGTFDLWRNDPEFAMLIEEINWHKKNFFEDHLCQLVKGGDTSATIFVNKTFNKDRGYNEKVDVDVNLSGETVHSIIKIDTLDLPIKTRKELLKSLRQQKPKQIAG